MTLARCSVVIECALACALVVAGCAGPASPDESADNAEPPTTFDPLVQTLDRAERVQPAIDERAAEQRRRIDAQ